MNRTEPLPMWVDEPPHLLIRASAGSGKTYRLSSRYLSLVRMGYRPDAILATTFTRKAAGEVLGRVITRLARATTDDSARRELSGSLRGGALTRDDCMAMLRGLVDAMHRLSISTIDGFFNRIAQSFSHELDLPPEPRLVDESHPTVTTIRHDAIEAMLGAAGQTDEALQSFIALLRRFHHDLAARSVTGALDDIIQGAYEVYREAPDAALWSKLQPHGLLKDDALREAVDALEASAPSLPNNGHWRNAYAANLQAARLGDWDRFVGSGLARKLCEKEGTFHGKPIEGGVRSALERLIGHAGALLIHKTALQTEATHSLLDRFDAHYGAMRRRRGLLLFSDLTHKLARELPGAAAGDGLIEDMFFRLDGRVTHLLLDEFQDTSLAQWRVLERFAQEAAAVSDGSRSLFVVGDTKQAIYGWRGGVAELFDRIENELMLGPESVTSMNISYRSSGVVLGAVNEVFERLDRATVLAGDADTVARWQNGFETHKPARDLPGYVTLETSPADDADQDDDSADEDEESPLISGEHERYVARRVRAIQEREGGCGTLGVLVRTNAAASRLIFEIGRLGVPVSGEGGGSLTDTPAVSAMLSALLLADHPGDSASAFHVLNSPLADVVGLKTLDDRAHVRRVALSIRRTLLTWGYARALADWSRAVASACDARAMIRLTQLIELADEFDAGDVLRPSRFVALAESVRVAEPSPAAVRVMTIHGAKGLEFDTVVLAELDKACRDDTPLLVLREHPTAPISAVYRNPSRQVRALDDRLEAAHAQHRASRLMDDLCALYVAMTRARQALYMIVKPRKLKKDGAYGALGLRYASILRETLCADVEESPGGREVLYAIGDVDWTCRGAKPQAVPDDAESYLGEVKLHEAAGASRRFWPMVSPSSRAGGERTAAALLDISTDSEDARRYGTLIHAWMEAVGFIGEDEPPGDAELRRISARVKPGADAAWLGARIAWFRRLLSEPVARAVLSRQGAAECWRERAFAVYAGRELLRGCFDRVSVFRDGSGRAVRAELVDFKTDRVGPEGTGPLVEHYRPQMQAYRRAIAKLLRLDPSAVTAKLWFVGSGDVVAVPE